MPLEEFIHAVQCWRSSCPAVHQGVLSTLLGAIVAEIICVLQKVKLMLTSFFLFIFFIHLMLFKCYVGTTELCSENVIFVLQVKIFLSVGMEKTGNFICPNFILWCISQIYAYSHVRNELS